MPEKRVFCLEKDFSGRPCCVEYPDGIPTEGPSSRKERLIIPYDPVKGPVNFDSFVLFHRVPLKTPLKESIMARPVEGFVTPDGKFFETESEANLYEARLEFEYAAAASVTEFVRQVRAGEVPDGKEALVSAITTFVEANEDVIFHLIEARRGIRDQSGADEVLRPAPEGSADDDTRVRDEGDNGLEENANAEAVAEDTGTEAPTKKTRRLVPRITDTDDEIPF